jgi:hypothetical protein
MLMKFRCDKSFEHSGVSSYAKGRVYDFTAEQAASLAALDKKRERGALGYFTPVDEAASAFVKAARTTGAAKPKEDEADKPKAASGEGGDPAPPKSAPKKG